MLNWGHANLQILRNPIPTTREPFEASKDDPNRDFSSNKVNRAFSHGLFYRALDFSRSFWPLVAGVGASACFSFPFPYPVACWEPGAAASGTAHHHHSRASLHRHTQENFIVKCLSGPECIGCDNEFHHQMTVD
jgi:hypothetical protein